MKHLLKNTSILIALVIFLAVGLTSARADVWGNDPSHNMVIEAKNLPVEFNDQTLIWEVDAGTKHQFPMPTIVDDKILVGSDLGGNPTPFWQEAANHGAGFTCYNMEDGSLLWRLIVPQGGYGPGTYGMCGTPVVEGDRVYIMAMWEIFCLDLDGLADGNDGMQGELGIMTRRPFKLPEGESMPTELPEWSADVIWHYSLRPFDIKVQDATSCSIVEVDGQLWVSTANEIGSRARTYQPDKVKPHMVVLDKETGQLIARDNMDVPIVFHGEWSSPSLIEVNGKKSVIFPDGYGVLHAFKIPETKVQDEPVILEEYWQLDLNPKEWRYLPDGREIVYTLDKRLDYKYPAEYYTNPEKFYMYNDDERPQEDDEHWTGFSRTNKGLADGSHESILGPCEIISMPAVHENRIYIGIGRDGSYGLSRGTGRFVCIEVEDVEKQPKIIWEDREIGRTQSTASIADGLVYIADGHGFLHCYEADTGKVVYRQDLDSRQIKERSQMLVDGKIYVCTREKRMKVYKAGRDPEFLGESRLKAASATIEAVDGKVVIVLPRSVALYGNKPVSQPGEEIDPDS